MLLRNRMAFPVILISEGQYMTEMTTEVLTKLLMRACEISTLPLADQAEALGTAYASYLMANGFPASELRDFLNRAIAVIEEVEQSGPIH
jgi:hypothetical protein